MKTCRQILSVAAALLGNVLLLHAADPVVAPSTSATTLATATVASTNITAAPIQHHPILDRWKVQFGLTDEQIDHIQPLLDEESAAIKPILAYKALTSNERKDMVLQIKLAARRQIRPLLSPEQQTLMDREMAKLNGKDLK